MVTGFGNGQEVYDTSAAISRLGFTPTMTSGSVAEWREMASEAHRQARAYENAANEILTATHANRSEEHTSELQSLMRISYAVFCLKKKKQKKKNTPLV